MLKFLHAVDIGINAVMATIESIALSIVSRLATWSAPVPSAVAVTRSVMHTLSLPLEVGVFVAITLEVFGIAAAHQWLESREWNATKKAREPEADARIGKWATVSYVVIAEIMIVTMELRTILETGQPWGLGALVFPPMTLIIVLIANERMLQHQRRMDRIEAQKVGRKRESHVGQGETNGTTEISVRQERGTYLDYLALVKSHNSDGELTAREIMKELSVPRSTAYRWITKGGNGHESL